MLNEDLDIEKIIYNKSDNIINVVLKSKRYIYFNEEPDLLQKIRDYLKMGISFPNVVLDIFADKIDNSKIDTYIKDVFERLFEEFKYLILYKSIIRYESENSYITIFIPNEVSKISDISEISIFLETCKKRLANTVSFQINTYEDKEAIKIRNDSVETISQQIPEVIFSEDEELEEDLKSVSRKISKICELDSNTYKVLLEGTITYVKQYGSDFAHLFEFGLTDLSGTIICKKFLNKDDSKIEKFAELLQDNKFISITGRHQAEKNYPRYFINVDRISEIKLSGRNDKSKIKRIELNIDSDSINPELLLETLTKWKHEAFGIMPNLNTSSFINIHNILEQKKYKIKPIYGVTLKVLMDDHAAVYNPAKIQISHNLCAGEIKDKSIFISDICYEEVKRTEILKKDDYIGIRNFCMDKALYIFTEASDDGISSIIAKSGLTIINVKRLFEILERKNYTVNSLMLKLNSSLDDVPKAAYNASLILKEKFEFYEDICLNTATINIENENLATYPVSLTVKNAEGLKNLYKIITKMNCLWQIVPKSYLEAHRFGLLIGSSDSSGELYSLLFNDVATETIYAKASFYDYINLLSEKHAIILKEKKVIKTLAEFRNFNKFLFKCAKENNILAVASCFSRDLTKRELLTTNEMLSEFSYLEDENSKNVVLDNTRRISMDIEHISPITKQRDKNDLINKTMLMQFDDQSESFKEEMDYINQNNVAGILLIVMDILKNLRRNEISFQIESIIAPYIMNKMCGECFSAFNTTNVNDFKIHVQSDRLETVFSIIRDAAKDYKAFFVNYHNFTAVHLLSEDYCIYDFSPMKMRGSEMITQFDASILKDYFATFFVQPDEDLLMINNLKKITLTYPTNDMIDSISIDDIYTCTADNKTADVLKMIRPASRNEFVRCIGLIHGQGTWYDNAERLIHEKLLEIYDVICFLYEYTDPEKNSEMYKESKRKIVSCITYEEAQVHARNLLILKWYFENFRKQYILEYINRFKDITRFEKEFEIKNADVSLSEKSCYIQQENYSSIIEPLKEIKYIDDDLINKIISNRPYTSVEDFALRNSIDTDTLKKLKNDGYINSLEQSAQVGFLEIYQ